MSKDIVRMIDGDLITGTFLLSQGFGVEHRSLKILIKKHLKDFEDVGESEVKTGLVNDTSNAVRSSLKKRIKGIGRPVEEYLLNEPQATFLFTLARAKSDGKVLEFKKNLTKEFYRMRKILIKLANQRSSAEWLAKRDDGIVERKVETEAIKLFVAYAESLGSENAKKYYMIISKMQNKALFSLEFLEQKFPNIRDVVDGLSLDNLKMSDRIVGRALCEGMENKLHYKEAYQLAKQRVETFASIIGTTPIQSIMQRKLVSIH